MARGDLRVREAERKGLVVIILPGNDARPAQRLKRVQKLGAQRGVGLDATAAQTNLARPILVFDGEVHLRLDLRALFEDEGRPRILHAAEVRARHHLKSFRRQGIQDRHHRVAAWEVR
eukprot:CAMPEP_0177170882 /NCGR_PEP_ID=MMETSP0367-20130122/10330_1 /TAXON_ID=447022 ORGANISM="Scrippsiella hangoei-like, Strain SHHI-4" /NCGR_SAMPLE_ID=MMETSP0367 /ASSEMBLY_ACC=CAM_ASM_000362 /LENGTH=117 /DNA_ID=CAMNT_0018617099 /DNA_START=170 /DNA_END=523 /DNA_ORIENTATION=+